MGLNGLSEQVNQVIGLGVGGVVVFAVGATNALWFDLATFLLGALVVALTIRHRPVVGTPSAGLVGLLPRHRRPVGATWPTTGCSPPCWRSAWRRPGPIAAPEAVALAYAAEAGRRGTAGC